MLDLPGNDGEIPDLQNEAIPQPEYTSKADTTLAVQIKLVEIKFKSLKVMHFHSHMDFTIGSKKYCPFSHLKKQVV